MRAARTTPITAEAKNDGDAKIDFLPFEGPLDGCCCVMRLQEPGTFIAKYGKHIHNSTGHIVFSSALPLVSAQHLINAGKQCNPVFDDEIGAKSISIVELCVCAIDQIRESRQRINRDSENREKDGIEV